MIYFQPPPSTASTSSVPSAARPYTYCIHVFLGLPSEQQHSISTQTPLPNDSLTSILSMCPNQLNFLTLSTTLSEAPAPVLAIHPMYEADAQIHISQPTLLDPHDDSQFKIKFS